MYKGNSGVVLKASLTSCEVGLKESLTFQAPLKVSLTFHAPLRISNISRPFMQVLLLLDRSTDLSVNLQVFLSALDSDIDIKIVFSKVDSPEKKQLWTYNKNQTRQKWRVFKENQL